MAQYEVQHVWKFAPGDVNGSTEKAPEDLLGPNGSLVALAVWPSQPLKVDAQSEDDALTMAVRQHDGTIFISDHITRTRLEELTRRPRPGSEGRFTSVAAYWLVRKRDGDGWQGSVIEKPPTLVPWEAPYPT